jgi:phage antirepressor YoqD-like protein
MTSSLTPYQVIENLTNIGKQIDEKTKELQQFDEDAVIARAAHKRNYAKHFLSTEGSMDIRKFTAELKTEKEYLDYELCEQKMRACQSQLRALRDRLEIGRSLSPLIRLEWGQS